MENFLDLVKKRHSVRVFENKPIPAADIEYILQAAQFAPSAFNAQNFKFLVTHDREKIKKIAEATEMAFIATAPVVVVAIGKDEENKYNVVDVSIALDHLQLAAAEKEIGSCWIGTLGHWNVEEALGLSDFEKVYTVMPLGYDQGKLLPKKRKDFDELFEIE
jgi:nitroreductase